MSHEYNKSFVPRSPAEVYAMQEDLARKNALLRKCRSVLSFMNDAIAADMEQEIEKELADGQ